LHGTYGAVQGMRTTFSSYFEEYLKDRKENYNLNQNQRNIFDKCKNNDIKIQQFSDCLAISMPLNDVATKVPIKGVVGILTAAATTLLTCLSNCQPIRGGIDIGLALEIDKNEVYGPALSNAYKLENSVAHYPRVVIGDGLINYLNFYYNPPKKDIYATISKLCAERCLSILAKDDDGHIFIDYLNIYFKQTIDKADGKDLFLKANEFATTELQKHREANNDTLVRKYAPLTKYFESRTSIWK